MELCDKYLYELINIDPTMNDYFLFDKFKDKKHIQPNIYSEDYYHRLHNLDKKYQKILEKKKKKTFHDKILLRDILHNIHHQNYTKQIIKKLLLLLKQTPQEK